MIATRQIGSANTFTKQHIATNNKTLRFAVKTNMTGGMAGGRGARAEEQVRKALGNLAPVERLDVAVRDRVGMRVQPCLEPGARFRAGGADHHRQHAAAVALERSDARGVCPALSAVAVMFGYGILALDMTPAQRRAGRDRVVVQLSMVFLGARALRGGAQLGDALAVQRL